MSKSDLRARPLFARRRESIEAHLTIVFAALAVSRTIQTRTGITLRRFLRQLRPLRSATIEINGAVQKPKALSRLTQLGYDSVMISDLDAAVASLTDTCRSLFGDESRWIEPDGYRDSLALCVIDSIFSTGSHYTSVINVVNKYCDYRRAQGADPYRDGPEELLATFAEVRGSQEWARVVVANAKPAHTKPGAPLKAEVVRQAAESLGAIQVMTPQDVQKSFKEDDDLTLLKETWLKLPSQGSGVTFDYFLILAGLQSVKPDRMVIKFVSEHSTISPSELDTATVSELIKRVAAAYPAEPRKLDHVIWRYASGRSLFADEDEPESKEFEASSL